MTHCLFRALVVSVLAVAVTAGAAAHGVKSRTLDIVHPWTYATTDVPKDPVPVFMVIRSKAKTTDRLIKATSPSATRVEVTPGGIEIKPGAELVLSPKTVSLRLHEVKKPLHPYDMFTVVLEFQRAGRIVIEVLVEEETASEPAHN